jgi:hypothetical protein
LEHLLHGPVNHADFSKHSVFIKFSSRSQGSVGSYFLVSLHFSSSSTTVTIPVEEERVPQKTKRDLCPLICPVASSVDVQLVRRHY